MTTTTIVSTFDRTAFVDAVHSGVLTSGQRAIVSFVNHLNVADYYTGTLNFTKSENDTVMLDLTPGQIFWGETSIEVFSTMYNNFLPHNLLHVSITKDD